MPFAYLSISAHRYPLDGVCLCVCECGCSTGPAYAPPNEATPVVRRQTVRKPGGPPPPPKDPEGHAQEQAYGFIGLGRVMLCLTRTVSETKIYAWGVGLNASCRHGSEYQSEQGAHQVASHILAGLIKDSRSWRFLESRAVMLGPLVGQEFHIPFGTTSDSEKILGPYVFRCPSKILFLLS